MVYHVFLCVVGAALQEVFHWLQLRAKLSAEEFSSLRKSRWTWILTGFIVLMVVPLLSMIWFDDAVAKVASKQYFLFGAGVPLILKSGMSASLASDNLVRLGPKGRFRQYLGLR